MEQAKLVNILTMVESPFVIATIGGHTFGSFSSATYKDRGYALNVEFPDYMKSLNIIKVNGTVNTYTLTFIYQVAYGEDPNKLDKIFSKASVDRRIVLSYGDWNAPSYIYKEETGIITNVTSNINLSNSCIEYSLSCTSDAIGLTSSTFTFPSKVCKPSDAIVDLVTNQRYGLQQVFTGMQDISKILQSGLIASNDKSTKLAAQRGVTPLEYLNYLVNSMSDINEPGGSELKNSKYFLSIHDDTNNDYGGTYFKVSEIGNSAEQGISAETYELNVNFPTDNYITQFSVQNDQSWAILYEYSQEVSKNNFSYALNNEGKLVTTEAPTLMRRPNGQVSEAQRSWWSLMTAFPINATLTLKGLARPSLLMSYVKLNVWFHGGQKHVSSGLYVITKQQDLIDSSGYKTTLNLLRVGEDT